MLKREDIVDLLADKGYTKKSARLVINDFVRVMIEALARGDEVRLQGFGTFCVKETQEHTYQDKKTGETVSIPSIKYPRFIPGDTLRRGVREGFVRE